MRRLHLLVEGQTEETIARNVLHPHLQACGWQTSISILTTKRPAGSGKFRGGVTSWFKLKREIGLLLPSFDLVTTLVDYYGFPSDAPGMADRPAGDPRLRVQHVERAVAEAIGDGRLVPNLVLHEIEAWVFAAAEPLADLTGDAALAIDLRRVADRAGGPEMVNDGPGTSPSHRLTSRLPVYQKTLHGPLSVEALGLAALRSQCPHLDSWLKRLEQA